MSSDSKPPETRDEPWTVRRRPVLAALAAAAGSGCIEEARSLVGRNDPAPLSFSIKTLPADADPRATRIARFLATRLQTAGIQAHVEPMRRVELYRDVLLNQEFDLYVDRHPGIDRPDVLRPLVHSRFDAEPGWSNPFGYANLDVDKLAETQCKQTGKKRTETLRELQTSVARDQPFIVVAFPDEIRAVRTDRYDGWKGEGVHTALGYLSLRSRGGSVDRLRVTTMDSRPTENLNPLAVEYRGDGTILELLYDRIVRRIDGAVRPWLARSVEWYGDKMSDKTVAEIELRNGLRWHDGTTITADDVAFTYKFLCDTSLGTMESPTPAPRYREASSLVESADALDDRTARIRFRNASREVAEGALAVPVLPKHIWESKRHQTEIAGVSTGTGTTKALVWNNMQPVGSGPLRFKDASNAESLTLERFDDHFLTKVGTNDSMLDAGSSSTPEPSYVNRYAGGPDFQELRFIVVPSAAAATELLIANEADATGTEVSSNEVPDIGRAENVQLHIDQSTAMYHVGFNVRKGPFSNVRFRRAMAQLVDKEYIVEDVFGGYAEPAVSPLARHSTLAPALEWSDADPLLPFLGEDGELDVERARDAFRNAGFRYSNGGRLLRR